MQILYVKGTTFTCVVLIIKGFCIIHISLIRLMKGSKVWTVEWPEIWTFLSRILWKPRPNISLIMLMLIMQNPNIILNYQQPCIYIIRKEKLQNTTGPRYLVTCAWNKEYVMMHCTCDACHLVLINIISNKFNFIELFPNWNLLPTDNLYK